MAGDGSGTEESLVLTLVEVDLVDGSGLVALELVGPSVGPEGDSGTFGEGGVLVVVVDVAELDVKLGSGAVDPEGGSGSVDKGVVLGAVVDATELGAGVEGAVDPGATEPEEEPVGAGPIGSGVATVPATGGTLVLNGDLSKYSCNALISNVSPSNVCLRHSS